MPVSKRVVIGSAGIALLALFSALTLVPGVTLEVGGDVKCLGSALEPCIGYFNVTTEDTPVKLAGVGFNITVEGAKVAWVEKLVNGKWKRATDFSIPKGAKAEFRVVALKHSQKDVLKWHGKVGGGRIEDPLFLAYEPDDFFPKLVSAKGDLTSGELRFIARNPTQASFTITKKALRNALLAVKGNLNISKSEWFTVVPVEWKVINVTDWVTKCVNATSPNGTIYQNCTQVANGTHLENVTIAERLEPFTDKIVSKNATLELALKVHWNAGLGVRGVDVAPCLNATGEEVCQNKWAWVNTSFSYRRVVTANSTVSSTLSNFPGFFRLDTASFISSGKMQSACQDLRVISNDNSTLLNYEIESCNSTSTIVWFNTVSLPTGNNTFWVYYGSSIAANAQNPTAVWSPAGIVGVWHMDGSFADSSGYDDNATNYATTNVSGVFADARASTIGTSQNLTVTHNARQNTLPLYVSAWVNSTGLTDDNNFVWKYTTYNGFVLFHDSPGYLRSIHYVTISRYSNKAQTSGNLSNSGWAHIAALVNSTGSYGFVNGSMLGSSGWTGASGAITTTANIQLFKTSAKGALDEVRWYNSTVSYDWAAAEYAFNSYVGSESSIPVPEISLNEPADANVSSTATPSFNFTATDLVDLITSCQVFVNGTSYGINTSSLNNTPTVITANASIPNGYYIWWVNCTGASTGTGNSTSRSITILVDPFAEINYILGNTSVSILRFQNCSPDWEFASTPQGQSATTYGGIINATNTGTATGSFWINTTAAPAANWTLYASNSSTGTPNITLSTTAQVIWSAVTAGQTVQIWLYANCSFVSSNPGAGIFMNASTD